MSGSGNLGRRPIPYNHKLQLTVSLALPESDYNTKLGIFQVRVESLSANGKVILGTSYPTMLRFKSQPVRVIETLLNSIPLIAGLKSEVQDLKIVMGEFTEGYEPTAWFKVMLEPRAEFQDSGSGVPEIYSASLEIESELPQLKRLVWNWRRMMFVWISLASFVVETTFFLLFCRPVVLPRGRQRVQAATRNLGLIRFHGTKELERGCVVVIRLM
ncbi:UNVERIFIED_CONTAM: Seipin-2 [Sesamum calycinum]|uniref:Seipin-2 n=1 Tax=Sesamum calycinum TaxID=2727403 RepID=A0AAW2MD47_9LAMI